MSRKRMGHLDCGRDYRLVRLWVRASFWHAWKWSVCLRGNISTNLCNERVDKALVFCCVKASADRNVPVGFSDDISSFRGIAATREVCRRRASASSLYVQLEATSRLLQLKHGSSPSHCVSHQLPIRCIEHCSWNDCNHSLQKRCEDGWVGVLSSQRVIAPRSSERLLTSYAPFASADGTRHSSSLVDLSSSSSSTDLRHLCPSLPRIASPSC